MAILDDYGKKHDIEFLHIAYRAIDTKEFILVRVISAAFLAAGALIILIPSIRTMLRVLGIVIADLMHW